jgi:hypothetical protein
MRKIVSKKESGKKTRRNQFVIGGILIIIMLFSVLAINSGGTSSENTIEYNGFEFTEINGYWVTVFENSNLIFSYKPGEPEKTDISLNIKDYSNQPLYIYSEDSSAEIEVYKNLVNFALRIQRACPADKVCDINVPKKTCEDNFIIISEAERPLIKEDSNCIIINGEKEELVKYTDSVLFKIFGIEQ